MTWRKTGPEPAPRTGRGDGRISLLIALCLAACVQPSAMPPPTPGQPIIPQSEATPAAPTSHGFFVPTTPPSPMATGAPSERPSATPLPTDTMTPSPTPSPLPTDTAAPSPTPAPSETATPLPTQTPSPRPPSTTPTRSATAAPPTPRPTTGYRVGQITLPTYPYAGFTRMVGDPQLGDYPVAVLDRAAYDASNPQPAPVTYRLLVLENRYLRLGILPDLGGRIYECTFKPTGNNEFYSNPVIKPTRWGPPSPPYPEGANWWLAAGGLEWGFPVEEHGYEFGTSWGFDHVTQANGGVMVALFTRSGPQKPYAVVDIILPPDTAYFVIRPHIINPTGATFRFKWWHNAMLAPGAANRPGPELRFIFPASEVTVHSTGDPGLPGAGQPMPWPVVDGRDLSRLGNWAQWLGAFQRPAAQGNYVGVYDPAADEGMVRVYPSAIARGAKLFAMGWRAAIGPENWTDDGSGYVELHGGLTPTFDDWYELAPGGEVDWSEVWYPAAGIGGVTAANEDGALALLPTDGRLKVGLFPTSAKRGRLTVALPGMAPLTRDVALTPAQPFAEEIALAESAPAQGQVAVTLVDAQGRTLFEWRGQAQWR
ncbi:MAG: DUF5107 domain-containing protein [Anaerolineae bacterium]